MTREEAIEFGNMWLEMNEDCKNSRTYKFFQLAIKALDQESCTDCISRQYLLDNCVVDKITMPYVSVSKIKNAPPVTPQPKIGHWVFKNDNIAIPTGYFQCSECGNGKLLHVDNYCPCCGAQMESVERDESEVEE